MSSIVVLISAKDEKLVVDSRLVALELGIQHINFLETIDDHKDDFIKQGFKFPIDDYDKNNRVGRPQRFFWLDEAQALFAVSFSRSTPQVITCNANLIKAFLDARDQLNKTKVYSSKIPYWYQRVKIALSDEEKPLPNNYFCIYLRMMEIFQQLEMRLGYVLPDISPKTNKHIIPDISIGKKFNKFLRSDDEIAIKARLEFLGSSAPIDFREDGSHYHDLCKYNHVYPESSHGKYNIWEASAYPIEYSSIFDYFLQEHWIPDNAFYYLNQRDPDGVKLIINKISGMPLQARQTLNETLLGVFIRSLPSS